MALFGTFDTMQLSDLVQWIDGTGADGTLTITADMEETILVFEGGNLTSVGSGDPLRLDIAQVLLARRAINEQELQAAIAVGSKPSSFIEVLVGMGAVEEKQVEKIRREYAFDWVLDLFFLEEGSFHFGDKGQGEGLLEAEELTRSKPFARPIPVRTLIFEAMRRLDEWRRIREVFPSNFVVVYALGETSEDPVWRELRDIGEPTSVGSLCLRMGGGRFAVYKALFDLNTAGLVAVDQMTPGHVDHSDLAPVEELVESARVLADEQQFEEAREVLATAANLEPDNRDARELLRSLRPKQLEYLYGQIPPHRVPSRAVDRESMKKSNLTPKESYLYSRLSGGWDVGTLVVATPLGELETLRILHKLIHAGIVRLDR